VKENRKYMDKSSRSS